MAKETVERRGDFGANPERNRDAVPEDEDPQGFPEQRATVAKINGGASTASSRRELKTLLREVCSLLPKVESTQRLHWSHVPRDLVWCGDLPLVLSPII